MKIILCILDGWGYSKEIENNAIALASKSKNLFWNNLLSIYPNTLLNASGHFVGLPDGNSGNSEVGHITIGSGRIIDQSIMRVNKSISNNDIIYEKNLLNFIYSIKKDNGVVHIAGLLSDGGVHSHIDHLLFFANFISKFDINVFVHFFLDGIDVLKKTAVNFIKYFYDNLINKSKIKVVTVSGRYYAMDRNCNNDLTFLTYDAIINGNGKKILDVIDYVNNGYQNEIDDEFVVPAVVDGYSGMSSQDGLFFVNFRKDRAMQLIKSFLDESYFPNIFKRKLYKDKIITLFKYFKELDCSVIFEDIKIVNVLGDILSKNGMSQLRISETEKYNHVTSFFNGGSDIVFDGEFRVVIPSKKVATYDLCPEMSAKEITDYILSNGSKFDFVVVNYANADMIGHTGNVDAAIKAVLAVDSEIKRLYDYAKFNHMTILFTADHGNIEHMFDINSNVIVKSHSMNKVPLLLTSSLYNLKNNGGLCDIAPTVLDIFSTNKPSDMTGCSLLIK